MTRQWAAAVFAAAAVLTAWACGGTGSSNPGNPSPTNLDGNDPIDQTDSGVELPDAGTLDAGDGEVTEDAGTEDAGVDAGPPDAGPTPGPWPTDTLLNYSDRFSIPSVQSVGVDDAYNIWLLDGARIGVLRPGTTKPVWVSGIGQAAPGFGKEKLAQGSTVICGGAANQAYVGYWTYDLLMPERPTQDDEEFLKGDLDVVQLNPDGTISLTEHLHRSVGTSQPWPYRNMGIRNSNDWHYDEDRTVLACTKVMKGRDRGEIYIGTNHGVTRIRGLEYNAHRHPVWAPEDEPWSLRIGYNHGLGIAQNGDVLIANEWKIAILPPPAALGDWEFHSKTPWKLDTFNQELNSQEEMDYWRGFQQTTDGKYYLGSEQFGLWELIPGQWAASADWRKVSDFAPQAITSLQATDDGSLFIGTDNDGVWRMDAQKQLTRVSGVSGSRVRQLVYDPTVSPSMLYVLTNGSLTVIRGH